MNGTLQLVLAAALLSTTVACAQSVEEDTSSSDQSVVAAEPGEGGTEMLIGWETRAELANALAQPNDELEMRDVTVPGVLFVQHQYSVAALRLNAPSWSLLTGLPTDQPGAGSWGLDSSIGVAFPRRLATGRDPGVAASRVAAEKLFNAMVNATETHEQLAPNVRATTRSTAKKTFSCTKTVAVGGTAPGTSFECTIVGVSQVGSSGLIWTH